MSNFYTIISDHLCLYWSLCVVLSVIDSYIFLTNQMGKYKLSNRSFPENAITVVREVLINQFFVVLPIMYMFVDFFPEGSLWDISNIYKIPLTMLVMEFLFYYIHVLFHSRHFWKYHSLHHKWTGPQSISTFHCHPIEMALVNVFPLLASGIILGLNFQTMRVWHIVAVSNTIIVAHGGYTCFGRSAHDIHHLYKTCNYGIFGFLDKAHGTLITSN
jgi:sterol desaturase/sphingolipid hydroxylase (fatty acid hydroxylase superfamily)